MQINMKWKRSQMKKNEPAIKANPETTQVSVHSEQSVRLFKTFTRTFSGLNSGAPERIFKELGSKSNPVEYNETELNRNGPSIPPSSPE